MNQTTTRGILAAALLTLASPTLCLAQPEHAHDADHAHADVAKAKDFGEAARRISDGIAGIEAALNSGSTSGASDTANAVSALARQLGALALAKDSGVPREQVKDVNRAGKELADAAESLHEKADAGDLPGATSALAKVKAAAAKIDAAAPAVYFCPMHCEGTKTYPAPGSCPVCHMKLKKQTSERFTVDVKPLGAVQAGKPVNILFTIHDPRGMPVKNLEIVHEMPLHLLMVSKDLSWYAHEHPTPGEDGTFTLSFTFPQAGEYRLYHDFTPAQVGQQVVQATLTVPGPAPATVPLTPDAGDAKQVDGYTVSLDAGPRITTGDATTMTYTILKDGSPVDNLEPYLGAMGHLVIISQDLTQFVHSHPLSETGAGARGPKVTFQAHFKAPGLYKGWGQFQRAGKVFTVPFTFTVEPGKAAAGAHDGTPGSHDHNADHAKDHANR